MSPILQLIEPHTQDLGGFQVRRSLPHASQSMVGPFIFFDHIGPATFPPGKGLDVRPHPHINLATVTYLFDGAILHRDSVGSVQEIRPGAVNWMTAGRGIVHSERTPASDRPVTSPLHGIQTWIALPEAHEETEPWFKHHPTDEIPAIEDVGVSVRIIAGQAFGKASPVKVFSPMLYLDVQLEAGASLDLPAEVSERALYSITPGLQVNGAPLEPYRFAVLASDAAVTISATEASRCMVVGGDPVGDRIKWWNFVSSRPERIEQAKQDWKNNRFPRVPEETEWIPLPEG
ncbi:MAG: pirin family protein [Cyanobacteria bacterium J06638_20]